MKKFAMMLMNPLFDSEKHRAVFQTGNIENHIVTVRNENEALEKAQVLVLEGFGVLEVCGAFEEELVQKMLDTTEGKLCIGRVVYSSEQIEALENYWSNEI